MARHKKSLSAKDVAPFISFAYANPVIAGLIVVVLILAWVLTALVGINPFVNNKQVLDDVSAPGTVVNSQYYSPAYVSAGVDGDYWQGVESVRLAKSRVSSLPVSVPLDGSGYERSDFGRAWAFDFEGTANGCSTLEDMRAWFLSDVEFEGCKVVSGVYEYEPYTGETVFLRSADDVSRLLQGEHVVALKNAYISGMFSPVASFSPSVSSDGSVRAQQLANDPLNLVLSDASENMSKGSRSFDEWAVPANPAFVCEYASRIVLVKSKYGLSVTDSEKSALSSTLSTCEV